MKTWKLVATIGGLTALSLPAVVAGVYVAANSGKGGTEITKPHHEPTAQYERAKTDTDMVYAAKKVIYSYVGYDGLDKMEFIELPPVQGGDTTSPNLADTPSIDKIADDLNQYSVHVEDGKLIIKGSSPVAMTHGFYMWVKENGYGMLDWGGINNIALPEDLGPDTTEVVTVSPYKRHYMFNPVTLGYTTAYWGYEEWRQYLNWAAMEGYDMMLVLNSSEAIAKRVFKSFGLTDSDLKGFFNSPALSPWQRMGNVNGLKENPYQDSFDQKRIELDHRLLHDMRELQMLPVAPTFAGFVPRTLASAADPSLFEGDRDPSSLITSTSWNPQTNALYHGNMLNPTSHAFKRLVTAFTEEYQKEFGDDIHYFLADTFNEMTPPSENDVRQSASNIYEGLIEADPDAVWVTQGWSLVYQRGSWPMNMFNAWTNDSIPDDRMVIIDLAVDYNYRSYYYDPNFAYYNNFNGKNYVYSSVSTMGGKTSLVGQWDYYALGGSIGLDYQKSQGTDNMFAYGAAMEGFENNHMIMETIGDTTWQPKITDKQAYIENYVDNRYKIDKNDPDRQKAIDAVMDFTEGGGPLASFNPHPKATYQSVPGSKSGSYGVASTSDQALNSYLAITEVYESQLAKGNTPSKLLEMDFREFGAAAIGIKLDQFLEYLQARGAAGSPSKFTPENRAELVDLFDSMDKLLGGHPILNLQRSIDQAEAWGDTQEEKDYYRHDAQNIVTLWGPNTSVEDYAAKEWSGLISNYYKVRQLRWFDNKMDRSNPAYTNAWAHSYEETSDWSQNLLTPFTDQEGIEALHRIFPDDVRSELRKGEVTPLHFRASTRSGSLVVESDIPGVTIRNIVDHTMDTPAAGTPWVPTTFEVVAPISQADLEKLSSGMYKFEGNVDGDNSEPWNFKHIYLSNDDGSVTYDLFGTSQHASRLGDTWGNTPGNTFDIPALADLTGITKLVAFVDCDAQPNLTDPEAGSGNYRLRIPGETSPQLHDLSSGTLSFKYKFYN